jgi:hypothetical protein
LFFQSRRAFPSSFCLVWGFAGPADQGFSGFAEGKFRQAATHSEFETTYLAVLCQAGESRFRLSDFGIRKQLDGEGFGG